MIHMLINGNTLHKILQTNYKGTKLNYLLSLHLHPPQPSFFLLSLPHLSPLTIHILPIIAL